MYATTLLGITVQLLAFIWIIGLGFSCIGKHQTQYFTWTKKTLKGIWEKQWKLIVGIFIGWLLSAQCSITLSTF
jgi:hypothetical protein